ncbi:MAG: hypothetical protein WC742_14605 [Gallionellaceae bacterium]|jgi:hypothetical protein
MDDAKTNHSDKNPMGFFKNTPDTLRSLEIAKRKEKIERLGKRAGYDGDAGVAYEAAWSDYFTYLVREWQVQGRKPVGDSTYPILVAEPKTDVEKDALICFLNEVLGDYRIAYRRKRRR